MMSSRVGPRSADLPHHHFLLPPAPLLPPDMLRSLSARQRHHHYPAHYIISPAHYIAKSGKDKKYILE